MPDHLSRARLEALLAAAPGHRVAIVGDAMLDVYLQGEVERISPEAPVPVVRVRERRLALGGAANVAQNVVAIGATCELVAAVGRDEGGRLVREMLASIDADTRGLVEVERRTTTKTRVIARSQQMVRFDEEEDSELGDDEIARIVERVRAAVESADAVVLEDYNKGMLSPKVIRAAIDA